MTRAGRLKFYLGTRTPRVNACRGINERLLVACIDNSVNLPEANGIDVSRVFDVAVQLEKRRKKPRRIVSNSSIVL